jgi:hypothetical protein
MRGVAVSAEETVREAIRYGLKNSELGPGRFDFVLAADYDSLIAERDELRAALQRLLNAADEAIAEALGPIDERFVFETASAALDAARGRQK